MAEVRLMPTARGNLEALLLTRELPKDARDRVRARLRQLEAFSESGVGINSEAWAGARCLIGPWWLIFIYVYDRSLDVVSITTVLDQRTAPGARTAGYLG